MKLFRTSDISVITYCREMFQFAQCYFKEACGKF